MPVCCIKQCGARKSKNQPTLSLHRFPANETLKRKWIESIGVVNINPIYKIQFVCSMHFDESCFNKTLDVTRLHDGAVPLLISHKTTKPVLHEQSTSTSHCSIEVEFPDDALNKKDALISYKTSNLDLHEQSTSTSHCSIEVELPDDALNKKDALIQQQQEKINNITRKYNLLRQKVKSLKEQVRRRNRKIDLFTSLLGDIKNKKFNFMYYKSMN